MKTLKDFEKELQKCSKCGMCESVCPLFKIEPNDCIASKGKFVMLYGVTKGELKLSKNINKYLDKCLKCEKCNKFCPAGIDVCQILSHAKHDYAKNKPFGKLIFLLQSKLIFSNIIKLADIITKPFRPKKNKNGEKTVIYFKGCVNRIIPNTDKYISKLFRKDINIIEPDFDCCGLPFLTEGNMERFIESAKSNLDKFTTDAEYIVTDCASCESTLMSYPKYIDDAAKIKVRTFVNWGDLIAESKLRFKAKKELKITFHKPCHLKSDDFFEKILEKSEGIKYIKMKDYDNCCGFAGSFAIKNPRLSQIISKRKAQAINETGADYVITTCPSCILGLRQGLMLTGSKTKVVSLLEFLCEKCNFV